jgi:ketosteroid isomerase-like protein
VSEENVERTRRLYEAINTGNADALIALCDPNIEVHSVFTAVGGAVYRGHDGARDWVRELQEAFGGNFRVEVETYFDLGDHTIAFGALHGRGGQSGAEVVMPAAGATQWREGLCVSQKAYAKRDDALRDLGVSEDALDPITTENAEVLRQVIDAQHSGNLEGAIETATRLSDPGVEFKSALTSVEGATYRGHDGIRRYLNDLDSSFAEWRNELVEISEIGPDALLARNHFRGTGTGSGAAVELTSFVVVLISDGKILRAHSYRDRSEALEAVSLWGIGR